MLSNYAEVIEDSEPEREAARLGARESRRQKRMADIANFDYESNMSTSNPNQTPSVKLSDSKPHSEEVNIGEHESCALFRRRLTHRLNFRLKPA
jgi:hypothetical protein